jgi:heterodisulfide reductase subunit B2
MKLGYFPGCSLEVMARDCDESVRAIAGPLGIELGEIEDWACCGSTSAHSTNHLLSIALPARTLALAEKQGYERVLTPCAACFSRLASARHELAGNAALLEQVTGILQRPFANQVGVVSLAELLRDLAPEIKTKATRPLAELKIACYYGCLLVRPTEVSTFDDAENPRSMETVVEACGAKAVAWNRRLDCCGAGFSMSRTGSVIRLGRAILEDAKAAGADAVVVACPMCHSNLDLRQHAMSKERGEDLALPILFLSQLVGLALGLEPVALGLQRHFVSTESLVSRVGTAKAPEAAPPAEAKEVA